jgi:HSP20 family molecular chaperone IbpA
MQGQEAIEMNTQEKNNSRAVTRSDDPSAERTQERPAIAPLVDIYENADEILLVTDVPGVVRQNVTISLEKDQLTVTAQRTPDDVAPEMGDYDFHRTFVVPRGIDGDRISATMNLGVLEVHLPKSPGLKPRRIEVRAA